MSRYLVFFALVALAAAYPATDDFPRPITTITETDFEDPSPWFRFPPFGNIFAPLTKLFSSFADIGPRIEVDDDKFRVVVNVKDYKKEDLKVKVKGDFILVQGAHEAKHDDHDLFASQFFHTYTLPLNASASDVTATLSSDGYLDVTAPINGADDKDSEKVVDREVPIVESGKPLKEDKNDKVVPPTESADKPEKVEPLENEPEKVIPVESADKIENLDQVEPVRRVDAIENVDKVEPVAKVENVEEKVEQPQVTTAAPAVEEEKKEATTPAADREEVTPSVQDKQPQDNAANEISNNANEIQP